MQRAVTASVFIQALACLAWLLLENHELRGAQFLAWGGVLLGSAVAALLAPSHRLVVGTFLALPAVVLFPILHLVRESLGRESEYAGWSGALWIAVLTLPLSLIVGVVGSVVGTALAWLWARWRGRRA